MTTHEYEEFRHKAFHKLVGLNATCKRTFNLENWERWDYDQETGVLVFSADGKARVLADFHVVGTFSSKSNTWLWSWANEGIWPKVKQGMEQVRAFGVENDIPQLTKEKWPADEGEAWEMTAIAAVILKAEGAYRCPNEHGAMFVVYRNMRWVPAAAN